LQVKLLPLEKNGTRGCHHWGAEDTAAAKMKIMEDCGITVVDSPAEIGETMLRV
jgi:succinyl-CoA synthetase alpha subunit